MIQQILESIFDHQEFLERKYALNITVRNPLLIKIFFKNGDTYFIKAASKQADSNGEASGDGMNGENVDVDASRLGYQKIVREYDALKKCNEIYPGLVPDPMFIRESDCYVAVVMRNLEHTSVGIHELFQMGGEFQKFLVGHDRMMEIRNTDLESHISAFNRALGFLPECLQQQIQRIRDMRAWDKLLKTFPIIPQHGDLAINNIARSPAGLIVFDWEDYALVKVPGFDLSVLLASGSNFDVTTLMSLIKSDTHKMGQKSFLLPIIQGLGIKLSQFMDLIMINLVISHELKIQLGYGREVIANTENLIKQLSLFVLDKEVTSSV